MTTREARRDLCKLIKAGKPVLITSGSGWNRASAAVLTPLAPPNKCKGKTDAQRERARNEAALAALAQALKEAQ